MIDAGQVNMVFREFMKGTQLMTPGPSDAVLVCACTTELELERTQQGVGAGEGSGRGCKRRFCFLEHSILFRRIPSNDLEIRPQSTPSV